MKKRAKKLPRNPAALAARMRNAGPMRDRRDRRAIEQERRARRGEDDLR
ncbi:MAG: hypothetical protein IT372_40425 [Polyangiaceae bacterium]|nr:hypothetical protein [Polyangiaceae bacterium]